LLPVVIVFHSFVSFFVPFFSFVSPVFLFGESFSQDSYFKDKYPDAVNPPLNDDQLRIL